MGAGDDADASVFVVLHDGFGNQRPFLPTWFLFQFKAIIFLTLNYLILTLKTLKVDKLDL